MASSIVGPDGGRQLIAGAAGDIELIVDLPAAAPRAVAACCHPHPLYGGTLTNKVIHTVARSFAAQGAVAMRFNFRGVGASQGVHDGGVGETDDLAAVAEWARARWPGLPLWLGGFSFGSYVALRGAARFAPALLVTVAPPVGRWDFSTIAAPACPWLVVQGSEDELVPAAGVVAWAQALQPAVRIVMLDGATHFFHGRLHELQDAVAASAVAASSAAVSSAAVSSAQADIE
ncbi:MAG: alpha/beta hydrolase [Gammaproteobacteria bacterium]